MNWSTAAKPRGVMICALCFFVPVAAAVSPAAGPVEAVDGEQAEALGAGHPDWRILDDPWWGLADDDVYTGLTHGGLGWHVGD